MSSEEVERPRMRGRIHQVAFFVSVPAGIAVTLLADGTAATATAAVYAATLMGVFGISAAYHRGRWSPAARRWMRRLDHSMIFLFIAGSYTPVAVLALDGPWEAVLHAIVWSGAAMGVVLRTARPDDFSVTSGILYIVVGWIALVAAPQLVRGLSLPALALMVAGGLLYTAGAIIFAAKRPDPRPAVFGYHEVWHAFMAAAATCHFALVLLVLRGH